MFKNNIFNTILWSIHTLILIFHWFFYFKTHDSLVTFISLREVVMLTTIFLTMLSLSLWNFKRMWVHPIYMYIYLTSCMYILCFTDNLIIFLLSYEFLLLPSASLIFFTSPNLRSKQVWYYFLLWTQTGSFLIFLGFIYIYKILGVYHFSSLNEVDLTSCNKIFFVLILIGFLIKIPIWPFDFWLTKTHVEANTGFSIYLSGVLVKSAFLGIFKTKVLYVNFMWWLVPLCLFSSLCAVSRLYIITDLKKFIATATISEMSLITLLLLQNTYNTELLVYSLIWYHSISSSLLFLLSEYIYTRYGTRNLTQISGIWNTYPVLANIIFLTFLGITAFPLSIKFVIEYKLLMLFVNTNSFLLIIFVLVFQFMLTIIFAKIFFQVLFGNCFFKPFSDLNKNDFSKVLLLLILLVIPLPLC